MGRRSCSVSALVGFLVELVQLHFCPKDREFVFCGQVTGIDLSEMIYVKFVIDMNLLHAGLSDILGRLV